MNLETLAEKSLPNIGKYGVDNNPYMDFIKEKLNNGSRFYELISDPEILKIFANDISNKKIELGDVTIEQSEKKDYWNRGDTTSFLYTARILPEIQKRYKKEYKEITSGNGILPAGLDRVSQRDPYRIKNGHEEGKKTIWNIVKYHEGDHDGEGEDNSVSIGKSSSSEGNNQARKFLQMTDKEKNYHISDKVREIDKSVGLTNDQLTAVSKFITNLLKDM